MIEIKEKRECSGCGACKSICPRNAISMVEDDKGFRYPHINYNACINCNLCDKVCPVLKENKTLNREEPQAYAAYNNDENIRMQSSSGGVFSLFAEEIINRKGVVFGAILDEKFNVMHRKAETLEEVDAFRGSKYVQSDLKNTYKEAKKILEENRYVLFTGTPCQIEGLKAFLNKDYQKLYTQDLICHGVPSKKVWEKYLKYQEKINNKKIKKAFFRNKENCGWSNYQVLLKFDNGEQYINSSEDIFMRIFLKDIALRDSCYNCKFKKINRISDITVADFWGIDEVLPEMNDEKGTSLLIVNSKKGEELLSNIKDKITIKSVNLFDAISNNKNMIKSVECNEQREEFFIDLEKMELDELVKKYNLLTKS